jgi:hypothetical protein
MRPVFATRSIVRCAALSLALVTAGACGKKADDTATQASGGAIAPASGAVQVSDVTIGRGISADKRVTNQADTLSSRDTIVASVHTTGSASNTTLGARWTFQDGQVVDERTESISPSGDAYTEFHISKPSGWPAGRYTLHVLVNGKEVQTKDFTVTQ